MIGVSANYLISLKDTLNSLNNAINDEDNSRDNWGISDTEDISCDSGNNNDNIVTGKHKLHPNLCKPDDRDWIIDSTNANIKDPAKIISLIADIIKNLQSEAEHSFQDEFKFNFTT